ncbi:MAG TPA: type II secretion system minor pseudopilin GspK [Candidatus Bathyarchaeia archaeon]|nr:type II secretion system minor pseudopilin GspK [Candidatus Bathyarchaeia archaeon]
MNDRGLALVTAMLAVAMLTLIVVEMTDATLVNTHFTHNAGNAVAAELLARSAEVAGEALLIEDQQQSSQVTSRDGLWAIPIVGFPAGPGTVGLTIEDEQGKLSLNVPPGKEAWLRTLFTNLGLDPSLVDAVMAWQGTGAVAAGQQSDYCLLAVPCEPRHAPLVSVDELLMIRGFDRATVHALRPYVTAYPDPAARANQLVNVNTADPRVLEAVGCKPPGNFQAPAGGFKPGDPEVDKICQGIQVAQRSDYFTIVATGSVGDTTQSVRAVVKRTGSSVKPIAWRPNPFVDLSAESEGP